MKKWVAILVMVLATVQLQAQNELYVYQHHGVIDTLSMSDVKNISHSRYDSNGSLQADYVMMKVLMADQSERSYMLSQIDSVIIQRDGHRIHLTRFTGGMSDDGTSSRKAPRRTSLDGDFTVNTSPVDFFWEDGDHLYLSDGRRDTLVEISESKATADFFFGGGKLTADEVTVYYAGPSPTAFNEVRVNKTQAQQLPNDTHHIGIAGDCGTATAVRQADESYRFNLEHKAAYLCFLPFIGNDLGRTVLKKIVVRSDSAIAGVFTLDPERGMMPKEDTTHVITLTTGDFVLPRTVNQNTAAYMVIAPQRGSARLTCEFWVYDTQLQSEGVFTRMVDLDEICSNMVYVVKANCNNYVVDLGLPVKFLNHNMSAFAPEEYGGYYSYGELENKGNYSTGNYSYQNTSYSDIADIRLTDKDVAHVRLGGNFSLPTSEELNMLKDSCTWVWESSFNGKAGYKITGKNGNSLFMPAGGYRNNADNPSEYPTRGLYRTSQLIASGQKSNWFLSFKSNSKSVEHSTNLFHGYSIRPVVSTGMTMTDGTLVQVATDSVQWTLNQLSAKLFGTVYGINKSKTPVELGFVTGATAEVTEADAKCIVKAAATTANGKFSADFSMPKDTAYYYRAYAKDQDGNIEYGAALQFGRIYVDLGLPSGTKWANISLGTVAPYQNGNYYAWGETSTKASYPNDASNYRWYSHSTWIEPDRLLEIQATDNDAASINWGDCWMTPDQQDIQELIENCDFAASTMNGVKGYTITSRMNGNSLFMPLSGWLNTAPNSYASDGFFASSSLPGVTNYAGRADYAALLGNTSVSYWYRTDGVPVRPVYKTNATSADNKPMFVRTLVAAKQYDGQTETDTLKATVRGLEGTTNTTVGFSYSTDPDFATDTKVTVEKSTDGQYSYVFNATEPGVRTYYRAFVCSNGTYYYGKTLKVDAVGLVDLGLSVLWANVDIGSASDDSHGDFFRWGATKPFLGDNSNYYTGNKDITPFSGHDTATELWGDKFRMPTLTEFRELINNCDVATETSENGVVGRRYTSRVEGYTDRSIFIPTSGVFQYNGTYRYSVGSENSHWTSTNYNSEYAYRVWLGNDNGNNSYKSYGFPVRPVRDKLAIVQNSGVYRSMVNGVEVTDTLKGFSYNISGTTQTVGFLVGESRVLDKDNKLEQYDVATTDGNFQQVISGLTAGKRYYYRSFAYDDDGWRYAPVDSFDIVGEVDLGLSVKWANVNMGSQNAIRYGKYFQWGAKDPFLGNSTQFYTEKKDITPSSGFDTATELWGGNWRLPTKAEWEELRDNCTWSWTNSNGQYGMWVTSKKAGYTDRRIFLPSAGYYNPSGTYGRDNYDTSGDYWSSTFYSGNRAYFMALWNNDKAVTYDPFGYGFTVRPVADNTLTASVSTVDVTQDANNFTRASIECNAYATPSNATVGVLYGTSREALNNDVAYTTVGQKGKYTVTLTGLTSGASYYYVPYIKQGSNLIALGDTLKFTTYELVDLDLPSGLLWMNLDLGADSICGNGDYYQWGATVPYPQTGWNLYQSTNQNLTETGFDAVRNTLGGYYRLPTWTEVGEFTSTTNCNWEWTTMNGVPGYKVSSKTHTDRFIFLPTTGWLNSEGTMQYANTRGNWWSSTWYNSSYSNGIGGGGATAHTGDDGNGVDPYSYGSFLRPVLSVISTDKAETIGTTYKLRGHVHSVWGYGNSVKVGFVYSMSPSPVVGAEGCTHVNINVSQTGDYSYTLTNTGNNTTYYYKAYIYDGTDYHYGAEQVFVTMGVCNYQAIDLGLPSGTKWANMNVGAESESSVGRFFSWGETYSKANFTTSTYSHYDYNHYKGIGMDIAGTKYDAAHAIMGGMWSMPTKDQFNELTDSRYTKWEWVTVNGRSGYRVTSLVEGYTDRCIFLPASGWMSGTTLGNDNVRGYFWLSTFYDSNEAYYVRYYNGTKTPDNDPRWEGFPIRGVINSGLTTADGSGTASILTTGVDWTIGAATATLRGNFGTLGTVSGASYGFIVGNTPDIDVATADAADIITATNADATGDYSVAYSYDGGVRYFRAFVKVGDSYAYGKVKSVGAPMLLDIAFAADGTADNYAFTKQTCVKHGSPVMTYNADYKRYEADLSANPYNSTASQFYSIRYYLDEEFKARLVDGHTLEALVKIPYLSNNNEADVIASYENGGSGISVQNKTFFMETYINGSYRQAIASDDLDDQTGTYHHVVGVYDKDAAKVYVYVDGELSGSQLAPGLHTITTTTGAQYYMIGGNPDSYGNCVKAWNGSVVFARIYDDALTADQVKTLYDNLKK